MTDFGRRLTIVIALLAAATLFFSCSQSAEDNGSGDSAKAGFASLDLISLHVAARQWRETGYMDFSTPLSRYYLARGWSQPYSLEDEGPAVAAAVSEESILRYSVVKPSERWLAFNARSLGKFGGPAWQRVELFAGGKLLHSFELSGEAEQPQILHIPAKVQKPGDNEITFRFSVLVKNDKFLSTRRKSHDEFPYPGVAAYFSECRIYLGEAEAPRRSEIRDETKAIQPVLNTRYLSQLPNSVLSYAFGIRKGSRLVFSGTVRAPRGEEDLVAVAVQARTDDNPRFAELWSRDFAIGPKALVHNFEADLHLDALAGNIAEIRFSVTSSARFAKSAVVWKRLRLDIPGARQEAGSREPADRSDQPVRMKDRIRNVVFIVLDAARPDHFGCYGNGQGMTPTIDQLAESSTIFRNAIAPAPYTVAAISSLFSGLLPEGHGVRTVTSVFPSDLENMPRAFKRSGYYTLALAGTQFITRKFGLTRDCDEVLYLRKAEDIEESFTTMDVEAMERGVEAAAASGKPVFIYAHLLPPHWPYRPPPPFNNRFIAKPQVRFWRTWMIKALLDNGMRSGIEDDMRTHHERYKNNLLYADHVTGQLLDLLRRYGLFDDSLIIITADHGEAFGEHDDFGHTTSVYEQMIWIPLIVRVPGAGHREVKQQVGLIDFFPTLAELLDLEVESTHFDGRSIAPLLAGLDEAPTDYYYSRAAGQASHRFIFTLRGERYKYIYNRYNEELFDLHSDPGEAVNIIGRHPVLATYLRQRGMLMIASNAALSSDEGKEVTLSPKEERELRNLGYLQ